MNARTNNWLKMTDDQLREYDQPCRIACHETGPVAFGGFFYGITGFHGFHVFSGVVINIVMLLWHRKMFLKEEAIT